jgi:pyridoxamine 5'-phosphate oxidase-like protein
MTMPATKKTTAKGPQAARPRMPAGYEVPKGAAGIVPWSKTRGVLERAQSHWLVTIDADGKPHLVGQWGAWIDDRWYFEGGADTKWARNVAREPRIAMGVERDTFAVMVEGRAVRLATVDREVSARIAKQYSAKYGRVYKYRPKPEQWDKGGYVLTPEKVFAWDVRGFPRTVTRYRF